MFVARFTFSHPCLLKIHKNVTEKCFSVDFARTLDFEPWLTSLRSAVRNQNTCNLYMYATRAIIYWLFKAISWFQSSYSNQ